MIIQDIVFYPTSVATTVITQDAADPGVQIGDYKSTYLSFRIIGTQKQIDSYVSKYTKERGLMLDEVYEYKEIEKDSYWDGIITDEKRYDGLPTREEYNNSVRLDYIKFKEHYKENGREAFLVVGPLRNKIVNI